MDMLWAIQDIMGAKAEYVRHDAVSLAGFDGVLLPGAFPMGTISVVVPLLAFADYGRGDSLCRRRQTGLRYV